MTLHWQVRNIESEPRDFRDPLIIRIGNDLERLRRAIAGPIPRVDDSQTIAGGRRLCLRRP